VRASARVVWRCLRDNLPFLTMLVAVFDFDHQHGASLLCTFAKLFVATDVHLAGFLRF